MESVTVATAQALARDLDKRLAHVLEPAMRRALAREALESATPEVACSLLSHLARNERRSGGRPPDALSEAIHRLLVARDSEWGLSCELRREIYAIAREQGEEAVVEMLRPLPDSTLRKPRMPREIVDVPLGVRRSQARGTDPRLLELLARDEDPIVLEHWLQNQRVTEDDVVRLAASRPVAAAALQAIYESERWSIRTRVRSALAHNPYCPPEIGAGVVASLPLPDLRAMRRGPDLHESVRARLELELARRQAS
jgi:hypothetical protein